MHDWDDAERVRQRLAHRLHDGPIQELTAAQLFLDGLALRMESDGADPALRQSLERGLEALRNATLGCRRLMDTLRPGLEGEGELAERLHRQVAERWPDAVVAVDVPAGFGTDAPADALRVYRVVEELLDEARERGAVVRRVDVAARLGRAEVSVALDAGGGFDLGSDALSRLAAVLETAGGGARVADGGLVALLEVPLGARVP
ncbi:MAG TPA: histidine kinase [Egibacteraceae bacterium]|nr:histidine kinase [Egibacteraceae bacterium]